MSIPTFDQLCAMYPQELFHTSCRDIHTTEVVWISHMRMYVRKTYPQVAFKDCEFQLTILPGDMLQVGLWLAVHGEPRSMVYAHVLHVLHAETVRQVADGEMMGMC